MKLFDNRDRFWFERKFGSLDAFKVMENFMTRDAAAIKAGIPKRVDAWKRGRAKKQEKVCQS